MARRADEELATNWRRRMERFRQSGWTVARFCAEEGLSQASFYQWRRKLLPVDGAKAAPQTASQSTPPSAFAPVRLVLGSQAEAVIAAILPGGTRLEIPVADPTTAREALETLLRADFAHANDGGRGTHGAEGGRAC